jgi:hypothetical protein
VRQHALEDIGEAIFVNELLCPVELQLVKFCFVVTILGLFSWVLSLVFAELGWKPASLVSLLLRVLVLDELNALVFDLAVLAFFHDSFDDFEIVDLLVHAAALEEFGPVDAEVFLCRLESQYLGVHLLVGRKHSDQAPSLFLGILVLLKNVHKQIEVLLVLRQGVPWHLLLGELVLFLDSVHPLEIISNVMSRQVLKDTLRLIERSVQEEVHEVLLGQEAFLLSIEHLEEADDTRVVLGLIFMRATLDEADTSLWSELAVSIAVNVPPLLEDLLSRWHEASILFVHKVSLWDLFSRLNLASNDHVVLFEVQLLEHHTVHAFIDDCVVWESKLHVLGVEPEHPGYFVDEFPDCGACVDAHD